MEIKHRNKHRTWLSKQSAYNFFSGYVIPVRCELLANLTKIFVFCKVSKSNNKIICCYALLFPVLLTFRFTSFHTNQWTML